MIRMVGGASSLGFRLVSADEVSHRARSAQTIESCGGRLGAASGRFVVLPSRTSTFGLIQQYPHLIIRSRQGFGLRHTIDQLLAAD